MKNILKKTDLKKNLQRSGAGKKSRIRPGERISVGFVRFSAALTIGLLFLILGYIIYNGLVYSNRREYAVTSRTAASINSLAVIINRQNPLSEIPYDVLQGIFTDGYGNWKKTGASSADVYPYVLEDVKAAAKETFGETGALTETVSSAQELVRSVSAESGAIGLLPESRIESILSGMPRSVKKNVKLIPVRDTVLACNPQVTALHGNFRIGTINESDINRLLNGSITDWKDLNGAPMPVVAVLPPNPDPALFAAALGNSAARLVHTKTETEFFETLRGTEGAFSLIPAYLTQKEGLSSINLARTESGRNLTLSYIFLPTEDGGRFGGISSIIINTFIMIALTLLLAVPPGLFGAIYLIEYAREGRLIRILRLGTETLAGIPSIIFGLFGMLVFVEGFGWRISLISGCLTLTLMILPTIIRTTEEALKSVSPALKEGSYALGATRVQTIFKVVLPAAFPAISSGIILAIGRALGESAALIYTMGSNYNITRGLFDSTRTLAVHLYFIIAEGISTDRAFSAATVLIALILCVNLASRFFIRRIGSIR